MRILVYGNSGSGKSTLARRMVKEHGLAHLDLDTIVWEPGKIAVPRPKEEVLSDLERYVEEQSHWVVEGCYGELVWALTDRCTELWFLHPGVEACLEHCRKRPWEPHKYASKEAQDAMLPPLLEWVRGYYHRDDEWSLAEHRRIFERFPGPKRELSSPEQVGAVQPLPG